MKPWRNVQSEKRPQDRNLTGPPCYRTATANPQEGWTSSASWGQQHTGDSSVFSSAGLKPGSVCISQTQRGEPRPTASPSLLPFPCPPQLSTEATKAPEDSKGHFLLLLRRLCVTAVSEPLVVEAHNKSQVCSDYYEGRGRAEVFFSAQWSMQLEHYPS